MVVGIEESGSGSDDQDVVLTELEQSRFHETMAQRKSSPVFLSITSADDGFDVELEGQLIATDRGTASGHDINLDLFQQIEDKYLAALTSGDKANIKNWRRALRRLGGGRPIRLRVKCWNAGGPSQVTFMVSATGSNSMGGRKVGSHNPGFTVESNYKIRYDSLLRKNFIIEV